MVDVAAVPCVARILGRPLAELPPDLFIPPEALEVFLDAFEGPLDLLLYLIRKHNVDVLDIPMSELTRQYLAYVDMMHVHQLELAAEYLVMAAWLIDIKSRLLLPRREETIEAEADPRAELARRLLEYEKIKHAARQLAHLPWRGRDFAVVQAAMAARPAPPLPAVRPEDLAQVWQSLCKQAQAPQRHRVSRERLSVREQMSRVLRWLPAQGFIEFHRLFERGGGAAAAVVTFLAVLELTKEGRVTIVQQ
ncbi:MAG TPA: segregation/condensation protein A, partial [Betaproteobacteria bacterium]|nr:segregation/condensation protein A [Betaproteobacteria bacterium]